MGTFAAIPQKTAVKSPMLPVVQDMISVTLEGGKQVIMPRAEAEKRNLLLKPFLAELNHGRDESTTAESAASEPESEESPTTVAEAAEESVPSWIITVQSEAVKS